MNIYDQLRRDEDSVPYVYLDSEGYQTIAVGVLVDHRRGGGLMPEEIDFILRNRVRLAGEDLLRRLPWIAEFRDEEPARWGALVNMTYNLGIGSLLGFKKFLAAMQRRDWVTAGKEMQDSKWWRQVGARAERLRKQIETGEWV